MNPEHRARLRARAAALFTASAFGLLITAGLYTIQPARLLLALATSITAIGTPLALAAAFAPTHATRQAATRTLDLLLRLVPWYTPRN
ncbi:hypothetical protein ACFVVP_37380 [Streptomyces sp. NPDC058128]|uniref:hypothetical protein n=1 Tax=Streptomyces sp. NPDC058128 TaxID=3346352 RepID=UPI0036E1BE01